MIPILNGIENRSRVIMSSCFHFVLTSFSKTRLHYPLLHLSIILEYLPITKVLALLTPEYRVALP